MKNYIEVDFPDLVTDVKDIYWNHILPIGRFSVVDEKVTGRYVRPGFQVSSVFIDEKLPAHQPLRLLLNKYTFLARHLLIISVDPRAISPIHLDGADLGRRRPISCGIPIIGCDTNCKTEFFDIPPDGFWLCDSTKTRWVKENIETPKIDEYTLTDNPIIMNPQIPHRVNNLTGTVHRLTVNWTVNTSWKFNNAVDYFQSVNKILAP
jgi:hypothetical protein